MIQIIIAVLFWLLAHSPIDRAERVNDAVSAATQAYQNQNFQRSAREFSLVVDSLLVYEPNTRLNLAHAYYQKRDSARARSQYEELDSIPFPTVQAIALLQLGVLAHERNDREQALQYFRQTLLTNPTNEEARYNYELLRKMQQKADQEQNKDPNEPSEFAKTLKGRADLLILQRKYRQAFDLMKGGKQQDPTVSAYEEFINRLEKVSRIAK